MSMLSEIAARAPRLRGRLTADAPLAPYTWFRVGGPAEALLSPADEDDLGSEVGEDARRPREFSDRAGYSGT